MILLTEGKVTLLWEGLLGWRGELGKGDLGQEAL